MVIFSIDFDREHDQITIMKDGDRYAWGTFNYEDHMVLAFRRYQLSGHMSLCDCGHDYEEHLHPSGFTLMPCHYDVGGGRIACACPSYSTTGVKRDCMAGGMDAVRVAWGERLPPIVPAVEQQPSKSFRQMVATLWNKRKEAKRK